MGRRLRWHHLPTLNFYKDMFELKPSPNDPKDGELWLVTLKSKEISMEDGKGVDVQIAPQN